MAPEKNNFQRQSWRDWLHKQARTPFGLVAATFIGPRPWISLKHWGRQIEIPVFSSKGV